MAGRVTRSGRPSAVRGWRPLQPARRREIAARLMPLIRGKISKDEPKVGHFTDAPEVLQFVDSNALAELAPLGTSCPDHFLRTKIRPLVLQFDPAADNLDAVAASLDARLEAYREDYAAYYQRCKRANSPAMRDPNAVIYLVPGVGMMSFAKDKPTARIASEFYVNAINVMRGASGVSDLCRPARAGGLRHRILAARGGQAAAHAQAEVARRPRRLCHRRRRRHRRGDRLAAARRRRLRRARRHRRARARGAGRRDRGEIRQGRRDRRAARRHRRGRTSRRASTTPCSPMAGSTSSSPTPGSPRPRRSRTPAWRCGKRTWTCSRPAIFSSRARRSG